MTSNLLSICTYLKSVFVLEHDKYYSFDYSSNMSKTVSIKNIINDELNKIDAKINFNKQIRSVDFQLGDIVYKDSINELYIILGVDGDKVFTFPDSKNAKWINTSTKSYTVIRPDYSSVKMDNINTRINDNITKDITNKLKSNEGTFITNYNQLPDSSLQIGDIVVAVDPIQISFSTQNGYQYYPTVRTNGNPILPSPQQIKNISVVLIFPNEDSINNQLLNIYAMYRRTPFVNIRNKHICDFFKDIKSEKSDYIPVALESINIESVSGFPNTLQATLTLLPFDPRVISNGLLALRSLSDVQNQTIDNDYLLKEYNKAIERMDSSLYNSNTFKNEDIITKPVRYSDDFRESLPFRAFYQSMISEKKYVEDEYGNVVPIKDISGIEIADGYDISAYRPTNSYNMLHRYTSIDNIKPISFKYSYLKDDYRSLIKDISKNRVINQEELVNKLKDTLIQLNSKDTMISSIFTSCLSFKDYVAETEFTWNKVDNALRNLFIESGIDVPNQRVNYNLSEKDIGNNVTSLFKFLIENIMRSGSNAVGYNALKNIRSIVDGRNIVVDDYIGLLNQLYVQTDNEFNSGTKLVGLPTLIDNIWKWLNINDNNKIAFAQFLKNWTEALANDLNTGIMTTDISSPSSDIQGKKIYRLPIENDTISIDSKNNIIQNWNIVFSNKFVPINIQSFKYPFYQHLGSENASINLNIVSVNNSDFISKISQLSDRLLDSSKVLSMCCPELLTWLDSRITVESDTNNIFNVFGFNKVSYNSSNITNIQGQPGCWNIVLNLTQSNISVADYTNIQQENDNYAYIEELAKFICRLQIENDNIIVVDYYNEDNTLITDLEDMIKCSFMFSKYMVMLNDETGYLSTVKDNSVTLGKKKLLADLKKNGVYSIINGSLSSVLNNFFSKNDIFYKELKTVLFNVDKLHKKEYLLFNNLLADKKKIFESNNVKFTDVLFAVIGPNRLFTISSIVNKSVGTVSKNILHNQLNKILISTTNRFKGLIDSYKKEVTISLAHSIIKDPAMINNLVKYKFLPESVKKTNTYSNCYPDFDIPNFSIDNKFTVLSPDFYLYKPSVYSKDIYEYLNTSLDTISRVDNLSQMINFSDYESYINKYEDIRSKIDFDSTKLDKIDKILQYKTNITDSLDYVRKQYFNLILEDKTEISKDDSDKIVAILDTLDNDVRFKNNPDQVAAIKSYYGMVLRIRGTSQHINTDEFKIDMIKAARMGLIVEILEIYVAINEFLGAIVKNRSDDYINSVVKTAATNVSLKSIFDKFFSSSNNIADTNKILVTSLTDIQFKVKKILENPETNVLPDKININFQKGLPYNPDDKKYTVLPELQVLETNLYNKIGSLIRMNLFIDDVKSNVAKKVNVSDYVPEYAALDYWNVQQKESNKERVDLLQQLQNATSHHNNGFLKMYPTFKIYFVEENKGLTFEFSNYFSYNAVQSIEIIKQKSSASNTAVIRLSNIAGNLSDRFSFMREQVDTFAAVNPNVNNIKFLGTLNIKPGTQMIVKQGYASDEKNLKTVFIGKIIEMNPGPDIEIICQSYGAQLSYEIPRMKFNMFSREKAYGEIVSAILDKIPDLNKMGKFDLFNQGLQTFSGINLRNYKSNFYERFMLSNLFGKVSALEFAKDNPRDENIYLPYNLLINSLYHPTFDWIIYNQSIWEAIQEICLYNDNATPMVKIFNDDFMSNKNQIRETLVIGDKSGYYKYTDSFALSSLDYKKIDEVIKESSTIISTILSFKIDAFNKEETQRRGFFISNTGNRYKLNSNLINVYSFFQNELNVKVMIKYLMSKIEFTTKVDISDIMEVITGSSSLFTKKDSNTELLSSICKFYSLGPITDDIREYYFDSARANDMNRIEYFNDIIKYIQKSNLDFNLNKEMLYDVNTVLSNKDDNLASNLQYKKIQQHHLITDTRDIISNNIILNSSFANSVNLYYFDEPKFQHASMELITEKDINNLKIFPIKAFGDIQDSGLRPLNSFQKNIDTNWFDVKNKSDLFYNKYKRIYNNHDDLKKYLSKNDTDSPSWDFFPSFVITAVNLLKQEVSKMYQGTIDIIGNPEIEPYDIVHISDYTNDIHGAVEVEEVIHTFTPDRGFITTITPNLITYDRDPIQLQDIEVINNVLNVANDRARAETLISFGTNMVGASTGFLLSGIGGIVTSTLATGNFLYNGIYNVIMKKQKFLYDQMAQILGRDCINFTTLIYHGLPYITGFDGVDYENLKTIIRHNVAGIKNPVTRLAAFWDPYEAGLIRGVDDFKAINALTPSFLRFLPNRK